MRRGRGRIAAAPSLAAESRGSGQENDIVGRDVAGLFRPQHSYGLGHVGFVLEGDPHIGANLCDDDVVPVEEFVPALHEVGLADGGVGLAAGGIAGAKVAREAMAARRLDGMLLVKQESMYWLTGYDTCGYGFFQCLVLRADGRPAADVSCPEPLPTRSGSSIRCMVRLDDGQVYGVTVKLRSVEGNRTNYDIEVDETPTT